MPNKKKKTTQKFKIATEQVLNSMRGAKNTDFGFNRLGFC